MTRSYIGPLERVLTKNTLRILDLFYLVGGMPQTKDMLREQLEGMHEKTLNRELNKLITFNYMTTEKGEYYFNVDTVKQFNEIANYLRQKLEQLEKKKTDEICELIKSLDGKVD